MTASHTGPAPPTSEVLTPGEASTYDAKTATGSSEADALNGSSNVDNVNEYIIDDQLSPLERFKHGLQHTYSRLQTLRNLLHEVVAEYGYECVGDRLMQLMQEDDVQVKITILGELPTLPITTGGIVTTVTTSSKPSATPSATAAASTDSSSLVQRRHTILLGYIQPLLVDNVTEVREAAIGALVQYIQSLPTTSNADDAVQQVDACKVDVLKILSELLSHYNDDHRVIALSISQQLLSSLSSEHVITHILPHICSLSDNTSFRVRRAVAQMIGSVAKVVDSDVTQSKLLSNFSKLCADLIWGVRRGCVDSVVELLETLSDVQVRKTSIIPTVEKFMNDTSRWVRSGIYSILGIVIYHLGSDNTPPSFIQAYVRIPKITSIDQEVTQHTAYNFPAVVLTFGKSHWSDLRSCFTALVGDKQLIVRQTLACSLHEIIQLVDEDSVSNDVIPAVEKLLNDVSEVRNCIIPNLSKILAVLSSDLREQFLPTIHYLATQVENWRWRLSIAEQLDALITMYGIGVHTLVWILCRDSYSAVRIAATQSMSTLVKHVMAEHQSTDNTQDKDNEIVRTLSQTTDKLAVNGDDSEHFTVVHTDADDKAESQKAAENDTKEELHVDGKLSPRPESPDAMQVDAVHHQHPHNASEHHKSLSPPPPAASLVSSSPDAMDIDSVHGDAGSEAFDILQVHAPTMHDIEEHLSSLATSASYIERQLFVHLAYAVLPDMHDAVHNRLLKLANDKVSNVRVTLARCVLHHYQRNEQLVEDDDAMRSSHQELVSALLRDKDQDVRDIVKPLSLASRLASRRTSLADANECANERSKASQDSDELAYILAGDGDDANHQNTTATGSDGSDESSASELETSPENYADTPPSTALPSHGLLLNGDSDQSDVSELDIRSTTPEQATDDPDDAASAVRHNDNTDNSTAE